MKKYVKTFESFSLNKSKDALKKFYEGFKYEIRENDKLRKVISHYIAGNKLTDDEKDFVKEQSSALIFSVKDHSLEFFKQEPIAIEFTRSVYK